MNHEMDALLVVDDNEQNRDALARLLQQEGYAVTAGKDGKQALDLVERAHVDLVLLDIMMAGMNGIDVLKNLRVRHSATKLPIIMTTARGQSEDIVEALKMGANDYVTKPIDFPVLLARIQTQLSLKHAVQRIVRLEQNLTQRNDELEAANGKLLAANARMKRDLEAAARIQEAFLPHEIPHVLGVRSAWIFKPCEELAGDMLNVFPLDDNHLGLYVLDVTGHGVAAALLSVTLSHELSPRRDPSSLLIQNGEGPGSARLVEPALVADLLNSRFAWDPATEQFFTLIYGILNVHTGELRYISAGHPGPILLPHDAGPVLLEKPSLPIGVGEASYQERRLQLRAGDRLYLYSDGLVEARNANRELFGKERLLAALEQGRTLSPEEGLAALWREVEQWCGGTRFKDDISLLTLEFTGVPVTSGSPSSSPSWEPLGLHKA
jgi:sigma-B regulation protein RsbU (phosphoserine phosphatase)